MVVKNHQSLCRLVEHTESSNVGLTSERGEEELEKVYTGSLRITNTRRQICVEDVTQILGNMKKL